jgi:hypothetical protein
MIPDISRRTFWGLMVVMLTFIGWMGWRGVMELSAMKARDIAARDLAQSFRGKTVKVGGRTGTVVRAYRPHSYGPWAAEVVLDSQPPVVTTVDIDVLKIQPETPHAR